jgi:hypothetical protein
MPPIKPYPMKKSPLIRKVPLRRGKAPERIPKGATTIDRLLGEGKVQRASTFTAKPKPMRKRRPATGPTQIEFFREIWAERPHYSAVSGVFLGDEMQPIFMSHCLPKGSYRRFKFDKRNIVLLTANEHRAWHDQGPERLMLRPEWKNVCLRYYELRDLANEVDV